VLQSLSDDLQEVAAFEVEPDTSFSLDYSKIQNRVENHAVMLKPD